MESPHRVRSLLRFLNYGYLKKEKKIPKENFFTNIPKGGKYFPLYKKLGPSEFGLFMEKIVSIFILRKDLPLEDNILTDYFPKKDFFNPSDYLGFGNILRNHFSGETPNFQVEWERGSIQGHPDIVYEDTVYDIKTTGNFNAMRIQTILQLLSYFCLAQLTYSDGRIKKIGLILPLQSLIITINLEYWDWEGFWEELKECVKEKIKRESTSIADINSMFSFQYSLNSFLGTHIKKDKLLEYIIPFGKPLQFFVGGNSSSNIKLSQKFKNQLKENILLSNFEKYGSKNVPVFIHSPYCLNLSNPWGNYKKDGDSSSVPWTCEVLGKLLKMGKECNLKGVVVHCGTRRTKNKKIKKENGETIILPPMSEEDASVNMLISVLETSKYASEECPLLIETPAGETGEMFCGKKELISFFLSLPLIIRKKIKICVDTCHVFACGYDPYEYIIDVYNSGIEIALIHYNDSFYPKGAKKDKHAFPLQGYIGIESLSKVLIFAMEKNIPCVSE